MIARAALEKYGSTQGFVGARHASPVQCVTDHPRLELQVFLWGGLEINGHPKQKRLEAFTSRRLFCIFMERVNRLELLPEAWKAAVLPLHHTRVLHVLYHSFACGRGGGIRTPDPLVPNQMRYQTALRPVPTNSLRSVSRVLRFCKRRVT